ncbi:MAG: hypothetical protein Q9182_006973 [Xanthomendoza sp. 2 TL-2023]
MGSKKKRKHSQYTNDEKSLGEIIRTKQSGLAATLTPLQGPDHNSQAQENPDQTSQATGEDADSWTVVGRGGKKRKTNNYPALVYADLHRQQSSIKLGDLQSLVLYCLADGTSPSWISVRHHAQVRKAVVLFIPGLEKGMFDGSVALDTPMGNPAEDPELVDKTDPSPKEESSQNVPSSIAVSKQEGVSRNLASPDDFLPVRLAADTLPLPLKPLAAFFEHLWPVKAPGDDRNSKVYSPLHHMLNAQVPKSQDQKAAEKAIKGPKPVNGPLWESKPTPITNFISSKDDLRENDYVLHPVWFSTVLERDAEIKRRADAKQSPGFGWMDSRVPDLEAGDAPEHLIENGSLTAGRTVLAMDCEMCTVDGGDPALTRISLVSWDGEIVMDELVKPDKPIIDYLTQYSGITMEKMQPINTTLPDIQKRLLDILTPNTILVGHSLNSDLEALKLTHPFVVDTSILYPHPRGPPLKSSLKWLAQKYIGREIQKGHGTLGHDSVEDSRACLDLVRKKCEKGPEWGSVATNSETIFKRLSRTRRSGRCKSEGEDGKIGAIIDHGAPEKNFGHMASFSIGCNADTEVVEGVKRAVSGDPDGAMIPGGGVDLTWTRMRDLENLRGWSNNHRYDIIQMDTDLTQSTDKTIPPSPSPSDLAAQVAKTVSHISEIHQSLPPCTLLVVYSGTGDPRGLAKLQNMQRKFKQEYKTKKWDQLSVRWTDVEEQALKRACQVARQGVGFVTIT